MTEQNTQLLTIELFYRLPFGVMVKDAKGNIYEINVKTVHLEHLVKQIKAGVIKMFLRPMSSMTYLEEREYHLMCDYMDLTDTYYDTVDSIHWLNAHHFDYETMIDRGLALEAPKGMYNK